MKRHGNHGVINWMISQFSGSIVFRNNAGRFRDLVCTDCDRLEALSSGDRNPVNLTDPGDKELFLVSYEDKNLDKMYTQGAKLNKRDWIQHDIQRITEIILLRDPFNYFASRLQGEMNGYFIGDLKFSHPDQKAKLVEMWKSYCEWFLRFEGQDCRERIAINYNRWLLSRNYRDSICQKLGLENKDDESRKVISHWGGGSSFSETNHNDSSVYLNRWKRFAYHPDFRRLFLDDFVLANTMRIFGDTLNLDEIRKAVGQ